MIMPTRCLSIAAFLFLVFFTSVRMSWGAAQDSVKQGPVLEARFVLGPDQCPQAVQVWLVSTPDTIQGLEVFLTWDRPDFALFVTKRAPILQAGAQKSKTGVKGSPKAADNLPLQPAIERGKGLLKQWEYVEARGETGIWAKVTAVAYLLGETRPPPICPGETGPLFSIPLTLPKPQMAFAEGDSAIVSLDDLQTRGSDTKGNTLEHLVLRNAVIYVAPCRHTSKRHR